ncbi:MAG: M48 family metalloprotease [Deltaproteobacteria bacterium]|nr:M48 family metalloprotease [Deltaproteobacteria bacterium]
MRRLVAAAVGLGLLLGGYARGYPIAEERKLGERFSIEAAGELPLLREPAVVDYVNRLGQRIVSHLEAPQPFPYRFSIVLDARLNAFAVPGGFVYVHSGLLLRVGNEAELAGVLGHEIGHTHAHHIVRQQEKSRLLNYAAIAGLLLSVVQPAIGAAAMGANATAQLKYRREFEQEADYLGVRYMREAGFDPHGMLTFLKRMWDEQRTAPSDQVPPYMLSHPMTDERINHLEAATKSLPARPGWDEPSFALERVQAIVRALTGDRAAVRESYARRGAAGGPGLALHGISLLYQGDARSALAVLDRARRQGVTDLEDDVGLASLRTGDLDRAARVLSERVESAPDDAVAHATLGRVRLAQGDYAAARRELERAAALAPALDDVEYDLGQACGRGGDAGLGLYHLARALEMRGSVEQARAQYDKASRLLEAGSAEASDAKERADALEEISSARVIGR